MTFDIPRDRRIDVLDGIRARDLHWAGSDNAVEFLERLTELNDLPSYDQRHGQMSGEIWQHTVNNDDWEPDWVFTDDRIGLLTKPDNFLLRFLKLVLGPRRRFDVTEQVNLASDFNSALAKFGYEFFPTNRVGPMNNYDFRRSSAFSLSLAVAKDVASRADAQQIQREISRLIRLANIGEPDELIGAAKDLVESAALHVLECKGAAVPDSSDLTKRVNASMKALQVVPADIRSGHKAEKALQRILSSPANIVQGLAELRNSYGTGHGKPGSHRPLERRHAILAVQASVMISSFLIETLLLNEE